MNLEDINNFFGDMDLSLMDAILKGQISNKQAEVLDVGCGDGRNGIYFIQQRFKYTGWDTDSSKLDMLSYLLQSIPESAATFECRDLREQCEKQYDLVICSRVLHFAKSQEDFVVLCENLKNLVRPLGILYVAMDSSVNNDLAHPLEQGLVEFPDGKIRFPLTIEWYKEMKKGFEEVEPLKTIIYDGKRAQSFMLLRRLIF